MIVSLIVAMSQNRVIGNESDIPWRIPGEQKLFRHYTLGHSVVMGRITFESIGKILDGRRSIVVTRQKDYDAQGCLMVHNLSEALEKGAEYSDEVFVIGGEGLFREALPLTNRIYLTTVNIHVDGDAFFPEFDENAFREIKRIDVEGEISYTFRILERKK